MAFSGLKKLVKGARKGLGLPPITLGNVATKYAPAAVEAYFGMPPTTLKGGGTPQTPNTFPSYIGGLPADKAGNTVGAGGGNPASGGLLDGISSVRKKLGLPAITLGNLGKGAAGGVSKALTYAKDNPLELALLGLAGASGVGAVNATKRANSLSDSALDRTRAEYAARAPMRERGMQSAMNPARPDLSDLFQWQSKPRPISATARVAAPSAPMDARPSIPTPTATLALPAPTPQRLLPPGAPNPPVPLPVVPDARLTSGGGLKRKREPIALLQ